MSGGTFFEVGGQVHVYKKNYGNFLWWCELATVMSQAFKSGGS